MQTTSRTTRQAATTPACTSKDQSADAGGHDKDPLDREVVEMAGVLDERVDQPALLTLVRDERVAPR